MSYSGNGDGNTRPALEREEAAQDVEALLTKALLISANAGEELKTAKATRVEAENQLAHVQTEALESAERLRTTLLAEAEKQLQKAKELHAEAQRAEQEAKSQLEEVNKVKGEADRYRQQVEEDATEEAQRILLEARICAKQEVEQLKCEASAEIERRLQDLETLKAAYQEELEAQRLLTRAAEIKARYPALREQVGSGVVQTGVEPAKESSTVAQRPKPRAKRRKSKKTSVT